MDKLMDELVELGKLMEKRGLNRRFLKKNKNNLSEAFIKVLK